MSYNLRADFFCREVGRKNLVHYAEETETPAQAGWRYALERIYMREKRFYIWQLTPDLLQRRAAINRLWAAPVSLETLISKKQPPLFTY